MTENQTVLSAFRDLHIAREASLSNDLASARAELSRIRAENEMLRKNLHEQQMEIMQITTESQSAVVALKLKVEQLTTINSEYRNELNELRNNKSLSSARIDAAREAYLQLQRTCANQAEIIDKNEQEIRTLKMKHKEEISDLQESVQAFIRAVSMQTGETGDSLADDPNFQIAMDICFKQTNVLRAANSAFIKYDDEENLNLEGKINQATILQETRKKENFQAALFSRLTALSRENKILREKYDKLQKEYEAEQDRYNDLKVTVDRTLSTIHKNGVMAPAVSDLLTEISEKNDEIDRLRQREKEFKKTVEKAEESTKDLQRINEIKDNEIKLLKNEFKEIESLRQIVKTLLEKEIDK